MLLTAFLKERAKYVTLSKSGSFHLKSNIKNSCSVRVSSGVPKTSKVFGTPDETLALVFGILLEHLFSTFGVYEFFRIYLKHSYRSLQSDINLVSSGGNR